MAPGLRNAWIRSSRLRRMHHIRLLVLFDSVWDPNPKLGPQAPPRPACTNSVAAKPGSKGAGRSQRISEARGLLRGVVENSGTTNACWRGTCGTNQTTTNDGNTKTEGQSERGQRTASKGVCWAREAGAQQPLTSGVGGRLDSRKAQRDGKDSTGRVRRDQLSQLRQAGAVQKRILSLQPYGRPLICTEYMARGNGSTFEGSLRLRRI